MGQCNPVIAMLGGVLTAVLVAATIGSMFAASRYETIARSEKLANDQSQRDRKDAIAARRQAIEERDKSRKQSAGLALEKGIALAEIGQADRGLFWMLEALKTAPEDAEGFRAMVRSNLGAWLGQMNKTLRIIDLGGRCNFLAFSPDGKSFATGYTPTDRAIARPIDLWDTATGRKLSSLPEAFSPFAFRPDGQALIANIDGQRRLAAIDLVTRRVLWTSGHLPGDGDYGERIAFSPDGYTVLVSRYDRSYRAWFLRLDAATGRQLGEPIDARDALAIAADGTSVAGVRIKTGEAYIDVYELPSGRRTSSWPVGGPRVYELEFSRDAKSLFGVVLAGDIFNQNSYYGQIRDARTGEGIGPLMARTNTAVYVPSNDRLVTVSDGLRVVRDVKGRARGAGIPANAYSGEVAGSSSIHPDGRIVLTMASEDSAQLWQISADAEPAPVEEIVNPTSLKKSATSTQTRGASVFWAGLRADGQLAVSLSHDVAGREQIRSFDPATGRSLGRPGAHHPGWVVRAVAFSPDGRMFATGSNPRQGAATGELRIWDSNTGQLRLPPIPHTNYVSAIAFHPEAKLVATGDYSGLVRTWDTSSGREIGGPLSQGEIVMSLAFSPDGEMLAAGLAKDHTGKPGVRLWDFASREPIGELLTCAENVTRIEFRPDGRAVLAGSARSATRLWDTSRQQALGKPMIDEEPAGFRPDGRVFLTVGNDGSVKLRDAAGGDVLTRLLSSSSPATCAAFRGDGRLVVAGFDDGAVRLCDAATAQPVGPPRLLRHAVHQVAFTPDGRSIAGIDELGEFRTWPVPEPLKDESIDDLTLRIEARTGHRMETGLAILRLDASAWRERLEELGKLDPVAVQPDNDPAWHEPLIREAEQNGNAFAARWHLDRLIAARSDDWFLYARRARLMSSSGNFDRAAADYTQAERLGKREDVFDYQAHCVLDCTKAARWAEALWYLDRLIALRPDDGSLRRNARGFTASSGARPTARPSFARSSSWEPTRDSSSPAQRSSAEPADGPKPLACWHGADAEGRSAES